MQPGGKQVVKTTVKPARADVRASVMQYIKPTGGAPTGSTPAQKGYAAPRGLGRKPAQPRVRQAGQAAAQAASGQSTPPPQAASTPPPPPKAPPRPPRQGQPMPPPVVPKQSRTKQSKARPSVQQLRRAPGTNPLQQAPTTTPLGNTYYKDIGTYQAMPLADAEKSLRDPASQNAQTIREQHPDFPVYGSSPATIHGETVAEYDARYAAAIDAYDRKHKPSLGSPGHTSPLGGSQ
jgi:hypothetical protein